IERERTSLTGGAFKCDLAAEQTRDLAADRKTETRAAVFTTGCSVFLLKRFEDQRLFVFRDSYTGVTHPECNDGGRTIETRVVEAPSAFSHVNLDFDVSLLRELERVRKKIFENLSQAFRIRLQTLRQPFVKIDDQLQSLVI